MDKKKKIALTSVALMWTIVNSCFVVGCVAYSIYSSYHDMNCIICLHVLIIAIAFCVNPPWSNTDSEFPLELALRMNSRKTLRKMKMNFHRLHTTDAANDEVDCRHTGTEVDCAQCDALTLKIRTEEKRVAARIAHVKRWNSGMCVLAVITTLILVVYKSSSSSYDTLIVIAELIAIMFPSQGQFILALLRGKVSQMEIITKFLK